MYTSPFHKLSPLLKSSDSVISSDYLKSLKSELVAEFTRDESSTILVDEITYNKETVLKSLDEFINDRSLPLHAFIYAHKNLLNFLEDENFDLKGFIFEKDSLPVEITEELNALVYEQTLLRIKSSSVGDNFKNLSILYTSRLPFTDAQRQDLRIKARQMLESLNVELSDHLEKNSDLKKDFDFLETTSLPVFLNAIYVDHPETIDAFIEAILHALVSYQRLDPKHDKKYLYEVSSLVCQVNCKEPLREMATKYCKIFSNNYKGYDEQSPPTKKLSKAYWLLVILLFFIIRPLLTFFRHNDSLASQKNDPHNALKHWPKATLNDAQKFASYRKFMAAEDLETDVDPMKNVMVLNDHQFSGRSPFLYITQPHTRDSNNRKMSVTNKTEQQVVVIALYPEYVDAFLFFPGKPDTLYVKPEAKLCFYFGDSLVHYNEPVNIDEYNELVVNLIMEVRFAHRDPIAKALFQENFLIEFKNQKSSKKEKSLPEIEITDDFFITKSIETKKIKIYGDVSSTNP